MVGNYSVFEWLPYLMFLLAFLSSVIGASRDDDNGKLTGRGRASIIISMVTMLVASALHWRAASTPNPAVTAVETLREEFSAKQEIIKNFDIGPGFHYSVVSFPEKATLSVLNCKAWYIYRDVDSTSEDHINLAVKELSYPIKNFFPGYDHLTLNQQTLTLVEENYEDMYMNENGIKRYFYTREEWSKKILRSRSAALEDLSNNEEKFGSMGRFLDQNETYLFLPSKNLVFFVLFGEYWATNKTDCRANITVTK